jgi:GNAT superfamily N-acetyltransferase
MIRQATTEDLVAIRSLMESVPGFWQPHWSDDTLAHAIQAADGLAFVWCEEAPILGFACGHDLGFRAYLSELVVAAHLRRRGVARHLLEHLERELIARGRTVLIADVWRDAVAFYESLGWGPPDVVLLRRRLVPASRPMTQTPKTEPSRA